jgi:glycosyltransferase involved in cell wall biosynthesis
MPTHNRSDLLPRAARSVLAQTHSDLELIIVDDASSDRTPEVVSGLVAVDSRVRFIRSERNVDAPEARNIGIRAARGEYIAFLDDDDEWLPEKLALQLPLARDYAVVGCLYNKDGKPRATEFDMGPLLVAEKTIDEFHFDSRGFCPSSMLTRTEYVRAIGGFDPDLAGPEGMDLFLRLVSQFGSAAYIKLPLHIYNTHDSHGKPRITTGNKLLKGAIREFEKNKHLRSSKARDFRMCDIELIRLTHASTVREKAAAFLRSVKFIDPLAPMLYLKLYMGRVFIRWPVLRSMAGVYRHVKYRR